LAAGGWVKRYTGGVRHDYKNASGFLTSIPRRRWVLFAIGLSLPLLAVALLYAIQPERSKAARPPPSEITVGPIRELPLAFPAATPPVAPSPPIVIEPLAVALDLLVKRGDTLEILFRRNGLSLTDLAQLVALPEAGASLKLLKPGDHLAITHREGQIASLRRELDEVRVLSIAREGSEFAVTTLEREIDVRISGAHGMIDSSLFEAGMSAGMSDKIIMDMAGIFEWDIDFIQDVREGDAFTVIYEEIWRDGVKLRNGAIVAAEFVNQGKPFRAARYKDASGRSDYYTPDGRSLRKAFIRAPLNFTRISSNFNPNRRHPVLNTIRAHRGVDYAAPTGTPIRAAGDGKVLFRGVQGGYGNAIVLQHGGNITTLYGHMSKFGSARVGARVKQGDVIGYVGKSGLATGPHLHYEYRVNGAHRNPRTVPLPPADPVPVEYQEDFRTVTATLWRQLDLYQGATATVAAD
jgi:murein DD-endopeptidase MepM/ murein hydrolase activator NlpD